MMKALGFYVIIRRSEETSKRVGVLEIAIDKDQESRFVKGEVLHVGDEVEGVKVGDTVLYDKQAAKGVDIEGELLYVTRCSKMQNDIAFVL